MFTHPSPDSGRTLPILWEDNERRDTRRAWNHNHQGFVGEHNGFLDFVHKDEEFEVKMKVPSISR